MEEISVLSKSGMYADSRFKANLSGVLHTEGKTADNAFIDYLISEGGETFFHYLNGLGLANKPNMMVISSRHDCFYDLADLKGVSTLICLKRLNRTRHLKSFLHTVSRSLSPCVLFTGCFYDCNSKEKLNPDSSSRKRSYNCSDSANECEINKEDMLHLLESCSFNVSDMTEIKGLTYFLASV